MSSSQTDLDTPAATSISVTADALVATLTDGRAISVPLDWYPRLLHGTLAEREHWELFADGRHIHWPDLDEDLSVDGLLAGRPSQESRKSLMRWLEARQDGRPLSLDAVLAHERGRRSE